MAYVRKNLTPEQRSEQARKAALARKNKRGGRPVGSFAGPDGQSKMSMPRRTVQMFEDDYNVFRRLAFARQSSMVDAFHYIAQLMIRERPCLGKPDLGLGLNDE